MPENNDDWSRGMVPIGITSTKLTTNQHILHLILTIVTCGLWAPVWIVRAAQGNKVYPENPNPPSPSSVYDPRFGPSR